MNDLNRGDHFGVEERVGGEAAEEVAAVAVGPVHHGGDGDPSIHKRAFFTELFDCFFRFFHHFCFRDISADFCNFTTCQCYQNPW